MAFLTPRHVIQAYHELVLLEQRVSTMLTGALSGWNEEKKEHRKTRYKLQNAKDEINNLEREVKRARDLASRQQDSIYLLEDENKRQAREIQILRSQL